MLKYVECYFNFTLNWKVILVNWTFTNMYIIFIFPDLQVFQYSEFASIKMASYSTPVADVLNQAISEIFPLGGPTAPMKKRKIDQGVCILYFLYEIMILCFANFFFTSIFTICSQKTSMPRKDLQGFWNPLV